MITLRKYTQDIESGGTPAKLLTHPWAKNLLGGVGHWWLRQKQLCGATIGRWLIALILLERLKQLGEYLLFLLRIELILFELGQLRILPSFLFLFSD